MSAKPKVLVVDDDEGIRETMADILTFEGYAVDLSPDGNDAIAKCRANKYSVVLLDIRMPGLNGIETLKIIKKIDPGLRVIMITGYEVGDLAAEAMQEGAEALFRKPLDVATFLPVLLSTAGLEGEV